MLPFLSDGGIPTRIVGREKGEPLFVGIFIPLVSQPAVGAAGSFIVGFEVPHVMQVFLTGSFNSELRGRLTAIGQIPLISQP